TIRRCGEGSRRSRGDRQRRRWMERSQYRRSASSSPRGIRMKLVVVGQGGREHALAWRLAREGHEVVCLPGNPGMAKVARCVPVSSDVESLATACLELRPQ